MHIPDGFVSGAINSTTAVVSTVALAVSVARAKRELRDKAFAVPLLATVAAFVFAAQMLNFPIGGGTSGHFLGAVTAAALLGPWSACIVLSVVLLLQALLFGDGGITALGTNILNMGVVAGILTYPLLRGLRAVLPVGRKGYLLAAAITSWASIVLAAGCCAVLLALSGTSPLGLALPAMVGTHAVIGIGEALITVAVLTAAVTARPDIIPAWAQLDSTPRPQGANRKAWGLAAAGLVLAAVLALFASPFASSAPDGLESVAEKQGFMAAASETPVWARSLFPDYRVKTVASEQAATGLAGLIGTMLVFACGYLAIRFLVREPGTRDPSNE